MPGAKPVASILTLNTCGEPLTVAVAGLTVTQFRGVGVIFVMLVWTAREAPVLATAKLPCAVPPTVDGMCSSVPLPLGLLGGGLKFRKGPAEVTSGICSVFDVKLRDCDASCTLALGPRGADAKEIRLAGTLTVSSTPLLVEGVAKLVPLKMTRISGASANPRPRNVRVKVPLLTAMGLGLALVISI